MNPLSNRDPTTGASASARAECRPVRPHEVIAALRLILGTNGQAADESQAVELMKVTAQRGINLADVWVYEMNGWLRWAALPVISPGRTALYFGTSAEVVGQNTEPMETGLNLISDHLSTRDVHIAQALLDPGDTTSIAVYQRCRFRRMAELMYLQRTVRRIPAPPPLRGNFRLESYSAKNHAGFADTVLASYEDSLDCPPLNGLRNIEDILAGHKAAGVFDPRDWLLLIRDDEPVGVLLLSKTHHADGMELIYLGLTPKARGMGLAHYLMQVAEARVCERKVRKFSLAVDANNAPALKLYYRHAMQNVTSKVAMMRMLRDQ